MIKLINLNNTDIERSEIVKKIIEIYDYKKEEKKEDKKEEKKRKIKKKIKK